MDDSIVNEDSKVFNASYETHVFANVNGDVTIQQKCWPDDDVLIVIPFEQISKIVRALQRAKKDLQG
jgi:hypothetical protein